MIIEISKVADKVRGIAIYDGISGGRSQVKLALREAGALDLSHEWQAYLAKLYLLHFRKTRRG
jgi:hypothetical protein